MRNPVINSRCGFDFDQRSRCTSTLTPINLFGYGLWYYSIVALYRNICLYVYYVLLPYSVCFTSAMVTRFPCVNATLQAVLVPT